MDWLIVGGYASATLIGIVLGLMGSGGSLLTVPVLVYMLHVDPLTSTAYSLIIVGLVALIGTIKNIKHDTVNFEVGVIFAVPSIIAVFLTRRYLLDYIPDEIFTIGAYTLTKPVAIMLLFAVLMIGAALAMINSERKDRLRKQWRILKKLRRNKTETETIEEPPAEKKRALKYNYPLIFLDGAIVGVLTGLVGAGGGFLIIPALVLMVGLPMKTAVGTSLMIITAKSLIGGMLGDFRAIKVHGDKIWDVLDPQLIIIFCLLAGIGILIGNYLARYISGKQLKMGFGYFVIMMAVFIIVKEIFHF